MAQRIMNQNSYLLNKSLIAFDHTTNSPDKGITKKRMTELKFFDSLNYEIARQAASPTKQHITDWFDGGADYE